MLHARRAQPIGDEAVVEPVHPAGRQRTDRQVADPTLDQLPLGAVAVDRRPFAAPCLEVGDPTLERVGDRASLGALLHGVSLDDEAGERARGLPLRSSHGSRKLPPLARLGVTLKVNAELPPPGTLRPGASHHVTPLPPYPAVDSGETFVGWR